MKTRLLVLTLLGLSLPRAAAQESAPPPGRPAAPASAAPVVAPPVPAESAPASAAPDVAPPPAALPPPAAPAGTEQSRSPTEAPQPYVSPPAGSRYRLPPPRLYPIQPREEPPARHGDAGGPFALGVGGSLLWYQDNGYDKVYGDAYGGAVEVFASYDIWTPTRGLIIAAGLSLRNERHDSSQVFELRQNTIQAELTARLVLTSWLQPHVRAAVGVAITRFESSDQNAQVDYEDRATGLASTFGAGFTLRTPTRLFETHNGHLSSLSAGVLVEGGYTLGSAAKLSAKPTESGELTRATFPLGKLDRTAPYLRIMGVLRF